MPDSVQVNCLAPATKSHHVLFLPRHEGRLSTATTQEAGLHVGPGLGQGLAPHQGLSPEVAWAVVALGRHARPSGTAGVGHLNPAATAPTTPSGHPHSIENAPRLTTPFL